MRTLALAAIAAALFTMPVATPAAAQSGSIDGTNIRLAQADVNVRIGSDGVRVAPRRHYNGRHYNDRHHRSGYYHHRADCRTVIVKERRGGTVVTKRIKRC